jgi:hypothetical protein
LKDKFVYSYKQVLPKGDGLDKANRASPGSEGGEVGVHRQKYMHDHRIKDAFQEYLDDLEG